MGVKFRRATLLHHHDQVKWTHCIKVANIGEHYGVAIPGDSETETFAGVGAIHQHSRATRVEVETE